MKKLMQSNVLSSILLIVFGMILLFSPANSLTILCQIVGWALTLAGGVGIAEMVMKRKGTTAAPTEILRHAITLLAGFVFLIWPHALADLVPTIAAIAFILNGVLILIRSIQLKNTDERWFLLLFFAVILIVLGIIIWKNAFGTMALLIAFIGACMVYMGLLNLYVGYRVRKQTK